MDVQRLHAAAGFFKIDDKGLVGKERSNFSVLAIIVLELLALVLKMIEEKGVVDATVPGEGVEIHGLQKVNLRNEEFIELGAPRGRSGEGIDALIVAKIGAIALDQRAQFLNEESSGDPSAARSQPQEELVGGAPGDFLFCSVEAAASD